MDGGHPIAISEDLLALMEEMRDKDYRDQYIESFSRQMTARQMRGFRGGRTQEEFGEVLDKSQTQVARFEDPTYGWQTRTVFEVARKMNVAALVCFLSVEDFLWFQEKMSERLLAPKSYSAATVEAALSDRARSDEVELGEGSVTAPRPIATQSLAVEMEGASARLVVAVENTPLGMGLKGTSTYSPAPATSNEIIPWHDEIMRVAPPSKQRLPMAA